MTSSKDYFITFKKNSTYSFIVAVLISLAFYFIINFYENKDTSFNNLKILSIKVYPINSYSVEKLETINYEIKKLFKKNDIESIGYDFFLKRSQEDNLNLFKHYLLKYIMVSHNDQKFQIFEERNNLPYYDKKNIKILLYFDESVNEASYIELLDKILIKTKDNIDSFLEIDSTKQDLKLSFNKLSEDVNEKILEIEKSKEKLTANLQEIENLISLNEKYENSNCEENFQTLKYLAMLYEETLIIHQNILGKCNIYLEIIKEKTKKSMNQLDKRYRSFKHLDVNLKNSDQNLFNTLIKKFHKSYGYAEYDIKTAVISKNTKGKLNTLNYLIIFILIFILSNFIVIFLKKLRREFF